MRLLDAFARGKNGEENRIFPHHCTPATTDQPGHQFFSLAEVHPLQAPTGDLCPGDAPLDTIRLPCEHLQGNLSRQNSFQSFYNGNVIQQLLRRNN